MFQQTSIFEHLEWTMNVLADQHYKSSGLTQSKATA